MSKSSDSGFPASGDEEQNEFQELMALVYDSMRSDCAGEVENAGESTYPLSDTHTSDLEISALECHFNWINKSSTFKYLDINFFEKQNEQWIEQSKDDLLLPYFKLLTQHLIKALCFYSKGKFDDALVSLENAFIDVDLTEARVGFPVGHYVGYKYILQANQLVLTQQRHSEIDLATSNMDKLRKEVFDAAIDEPSSQAILLIIKSYYISWFDNSVERKALIERALILDPDVVEYIIEYYRLLREIRRDEMFLSSPSMKECSLLVHAFDLSPDSPVVLHNLCTYYHDALKGFVFENEESNCGFVKKLGTAEIVCRMVKYAKRSAELSPEAVGPNVRYAEVLTYGPSGRRNTTHDFVECEKQFQYCLKKWPNSSEVLHKFGKLYVLTDIQTALDYFKKGIEANPENLPCLLNFVRCSYRRHKESCISDMIDLVNLHVDIHWRRPSLRKKVELLKVNLFLIENKIEEAVDCWIRIFGDPKNAPQIDKVDAKMLMGNSILENETKLINRYCLPLVKFLEEEIKAAQINGNDDAGRIGILKALFDIFQAEIKGQKTHRPKHPCDMDDNWRATLDSPAFLLKETPIQQSRDFTSLSINNAFGGNRYFHQTQRQFLWNSVQTHADSLKSSQSSRGRNGYSSGSDNSSYELQSSRNITRDFNFNHPRNRGAYNASGEHRASSARASWTKSRSISDDDDNWRKPK